MLTDMQELAMSEFPKLPELIDVVEFLIWSGPPRTEREIAEAIFGPEEGYQQRVNQECRMLANAGRVLRTGAGGPSDPHRYVRRAYA